MLKAVYFTTDRNSRGEQTNSTVSMNKLMGEIEYAITGSEGNNCIIKAGILFVCKQPVCTMSKGSALSELVDEDGQITIGADSYCEPKER